MSITKSMEFGRGEFKFAGGGGAVAVGDSFPIKTQNWQDMNVQIWGVTTATVVVQGRVNEDAPWLDLSTFVNANGRYRVDGSYVQIRISITAWTAGTIFAAISGIDLVSLLKR